jgi:hypothetical protein
MIGVIANTSDYPAVQELFQLFKTPWEFYQPDRHYEVLIVSEGGNPPSTSVKLLISYSSSKTSFDVQGVIGPQQKGRNLIYKGRRIPIYGDSITFRNEQIAFLKEERSHNAVGYHGLLNNATYIRVGYDLFREIKVLLTIGQPPENADIPTLEMHIALLRDVIVESGALLVEIPPIPEGFSFIASLTHDVDHPSIRRHKWDHTTLGFLYRAVIGSIIRVLQGRMPFRHLLINWWAAAKLPFVHLGLAKDFWYDFDRYLAIEKDLDSTFFVLPFKGNPGMTASGSAPQIRASNYGAADIPEPLQTLMSSSREIGLHGIDAWIDSARGQQEMAQITTITGATNIGVRMHWLYFSADSPVALEKAGFSYDSTVGYNQTIGYRSGTAQVYKPLQAHHLLELPLHVMDTALFYPDYLNLTFEEADRRIGEIVDYARQFGGVVTFNWHDRSIAPERLWGEFYANLVRGLKQKGAWCASAGRVVSWFQNRRSVVFERSDQGVEVIKTKLDRPCNEHVPGLRLRLFNIRKGCDNSSEQYVDSALTGNLKINFKASTVVAHH